MLDRPYINDDFFVLKKLATENWDNQSILKLIKHELSHRKRNKKASPFKVEIELRLQELDQLHVRQEFSIVLDKLKVLLQHANVAPDLGGPGISHTSDNVELPASDDVQTEQIEQHFAERFADHNFAVAYESRSLIESEFGIGEKFKGRVITVTGNDPEEESLLNALIFWQSGYIGDKDIWQNQQLIVIGRSNFNEVYLKQSVKYIVEKNMTFHYLSQEAFLEYIR